MFFCMRIRPALAGKGHKDLSEHVEGRKEGGKQTHGPDEVMASPEGFPEYLVLTPEAAEWRHAGYGQRTYYKRSRCNLHMRVEPAHLPHILFIGHGVYNATGAEEEKALEKGVGHEMEYAGRVGAHAHGRKHVAELAHGGVGQDPLDVVLHKADGGRKTGGKYADYGHGLTHGRDHGIYGAVSGHHVYAGGDHRGGVYEGGDRCRALHGVGQPYM